MVLVMTILTCFISGVIAVRKLRATAKSGCFYLAVISYSPMVPVPYSSSRGTNFYAADAHPRQ